MPWLSIWRTREERRTSLGMDTYERLDASDFNVDEPGNDARAVKRKRLQKPLTARPSTAQDPKVLRKFSVVKFDF